MEIMIQTKKHMFSIGAQGYRKVNMFDWKNAWDTFEILVKSQSDKLKKVTTAQKREARKLVEDAAKHYLKQPQGWDDQGEVVTGIDYSKKS